MKTQFSVTFNIEDGLPLVAVMFCPVYIKLLSMCMPSARRMGIILLSADGKDIIVSM